jgi:OOP family OmpA-OmpF porin
MFRSDCVFFLCLDDEVLQKKGGLVMKRWCGRLVVFLAVIALLFGCAAPKPRPAAPAFKAQDLDRALASNQYVQKVDSYVIVLDASQSMRDPYKYEGYSKFEFAKEVIVRLNETLPEMEMQGALRTFGHGDCMPNAPTLAINEMQKHKKERLESGLEKVACDGGPSPLTTALKEVSKDLKGTSGKIAVIVLSDGLDMDDRPIEAARSMSRQFGEDFCTYAIHVGDDPAGRAFMKRLAQVTGCAPLLEADAIATGPGMADFVTSAFLEKSRDTDGDGVYDHLDKCPNTPRGTKVDAVGCPVETDADGDGVLDNKDRCPGTPRGVAVDMNGCPLDSDGDGVLDHKDACPNTPNGVPVDKFGCPLDK